MAEGTYCKSWREQGSGWGFLTCKVEVKCAEKNGLTMGMQLDKISIRSLSKWSFEFKYEISC